MAPLPRAFQAILALKVAPTSAADFETSQSVLRGKARSPYIA
jgi:hypothetical protein